MKNADRRDEAIARLREEVIGAVARRECPFWAWAMLDADARKRLREEAGTWTITGAPR